jgi:hypothetical protein
MIRPTDNNASLSNWLRPAAAPAPRASAAADSASFFDPQAWSASAATPISANLATAARGLSVEQHAQAVLSHLCQRDDERT